MMHVLLGRDHHLQTTAALDREPEAVLKNEERFSIYTVERKSKVGCRNQGTLGAEK